MRSNTSKSSSRNSSFQAEGGNANIQTLNRNADAESVKSQEPNAKERVYYVDWIRAIAIILVIFVHALCNSFDASGLDPDDVPTIQQKKDGIIKSLVQIGIPMFFYISGIGATFFRTEDKNFAIFVGEKSLRLLVPFIVGIFVFLIPRLYFGQTYEDFTRPNDEVEPNYWEFTKKTLPLIHLKLSWLWYLPALFIDFIICYPLLRWSVRRSKGIKYDPLVDTGIIAHQLVTLAIWGTICYFLVTTNDYGSIYLVPAVITLGCVMLAIYSAQLILGTKNGYKYALLIKLIGPCGAIAMNFWKVQTKNMNLYHIFLMINYDAIFFS
jgi:peptidoglycan/LPS O-acetylase OafA/YrhL